MPQEEFFKETFQKNILIMKKPTFSKLFFSVFSLFENFLNKGFLFCTLTGKDLQNLMQSLFYKRNSLLGKSKAVFNVVVVLILLNSTTVFSQLAVPFTPRLSGGNIKVKGDVVLIGNSVVSGKGLALPYTGGGNNNSYEAVYIDVDGDTDTFSSSTADLKINNSCKNIVFAGLYWASCYPNEVGTDVTKFFQGTPRLNDWNQVKFKLPTGAYIDLVADNNPDLAGEEDNIIFDGYQYYGTSAPADAQSFKDSPIICYKNVTNLLKGLTDADGTYTVANLRATRGLRQGGSGGGWTLVVIYESPTVPSKFISVFDGYAGVQGGATLDIPVSGYRTLPSPLPVNAKIGVAALEGDRGISDDRFQFKASSSAVFTNISDAVNPANNFFNSTISNNGVNVIDRNPASTNTLGFDVDNVIIPNPSNNVIPNNSTGGDLKLTTSGDGYGAFVTTFAVDIIEPTILLTKIVKDDAGNDASNLDVTLGQSLNYTIGFENQGNDDATSFTIKDILPINVNFNYPADIVSVPAGVTHTYNAATRTIIFTIPNNLVQKTLVPGGPFVHYDIVLKVKVVPTCNELSDACENRIQNTAYATYRGVINTAQITDDPSLSSYTSCNLGTPQATNFLVGVKDCLFTNKAVLCGNSSTVTASNGYASYTWTGPGNFTATGQTVTVTAPGVYKVFGVGNKPCTDYNEEITVERFGGIAINPVSAFADEEVTCPNDGKILPNIFLCGTNSIGSSGANSSRLINTNISDGSTIVWERLNEASCSAVANSNCANESSSCTWSNVGSGPSYLANTSGQFRVTFNYPGGCFNRFYFNVYQNLLSPTVTTSDIVCSTSGRITIGGVPAGYEYSLDGVTYQSSNVFSVNTANSYTAYIRQVGVTSSPCIFTVPDILIRERAFTVDVSNTNPLCYGGKGTVQLVANDVNPQYYFSIYQGATLVNSVGPIASNVHTFTDLNSGVYTVNVSTNPSTDNCAFTGSVTIVDPPVLTATAALTTPLTCSDGEITVTPVGGTAPYFYFVNSATVFQTVPEIAVTLPLPAGGIYNIDVVDSNNCTYKIPPLTVTPLAKPVFTVTPTNILCYGANSGVIQFNVTNANGYTLAYSIDNGVTYVANGTFSNLVAGTYTPILRYSLNGVDCFDPQPAITITEPASAVTASAGVSELAGCGIAPTPKNYGKVRITNPQGGVSPYQYSFDNQATWTTVNDAFKAPGTYNLYVRDVNGCIFSAPITLDPEPVEPQIDVATPVDFNCDGTATSTVTVANPGGVTYTYDYYLDGVKNTNTPNNVFLNVAPGTHAIKVEYKLNSVPTFSNLLNENFGYGDDTTSPGINTAFYCFERQVVATQCRGSNAINDGDYSVTSFIVNPFGAWVQPGDHTPPTVPPTPKGRSLVVNIGDQIATSDILYQKVINDIIPNQPINFELYAMNLLRTGNTQVNADLRVALVDASGTEISWFATGDIPKTQRWEQYPKTPVTLNPGSNTTLRFIIRSNKRATSGNDVAIDDIKVYQLPKTCLSTKDFTIVVPTGKAFSAQISGTKNVTCNGLTNGEITIAAQNFEAAGFQYSKDNGVTWQTATSSPVIITGLAGALYKVIVRPDASSAASCSKPFDVTINTPAAVTASASITVQATCTTGATITAVGGGGTPAYQYALRQSDGTTVVTGFNNNANFTNVPAGSYTVFVRDANGCSNATGYSITVTAPPALTATLDTTTDYCYTTANPATLVVGLTGGVGPFTYKLNSNAAVSSALTTFSFANVAPGPHTIVVTDSNNCTATISSIVIAPQIGFNVSLLNDLTCLADATIDTPVVTNGNGGPYTYTVSHNGGATTAATFPYAASTHGTYVFTVTDSRGCPATSNTITVTAKTTPVASPSKTDITCNNANDGTITVTASGGFTSAYTFAIKLSTAPTYTTQTTNQFTGLAAGVYDVKVIDSKGCESAVVQVTIVNPTALVVSASANTFSCSATNTKQSATVTIDVPTTGTSPYKYSFNGGSFTNTNTLIVNDNGFDQTINYAVRDASNCVTTGSIILNKLNPPTIATITNTPIYCVPASSTTSTVTVPVTAGTGVAPLTYVITSGPVINTTGATTGIFTGLTAGTYVFKVTDTNGCFATKSHTVPALTQIAVSATKLTDVDCFGNTTGSIRYNVSGFSGTYSYTINGGTAVTGQTATTFTLSTLGANTYIVDFTDAITGCTAPTSVIISQPAAALTLNLVSNKNANCNVATARVEVSASNGTPNYTYAFMQDGVAPLPANYTASAIGNLNPTTNLNWDVWVKDSKGCTFILDVVIATDPTPTVTASAVGQCLGVGSYTITATNTTTPAAGIVTPITYSLNGGAFQSGNTFTVTASGSYTVRMRDGNACIATATALTVAPQLTLNAVLNKDITCVLGDEPARITVTPSGGSGSFTYAITTPASESTNVTGATTGIFTTSTPGNYTFTVTDTTTGCTYTTTTAIPVTAKVDPDITAVNQTATINCNGDDTGAIKAIYNSSLGLAPFQFSIDGTTFQNSDTFTGLSAGSYTVTIRDAKGCTDTGSITINEPVLLAYTYSKNEIICNGSGTTLGSIIATPTGGTAPYTYTITNNVGATVNPPTIVGGVYTFDIVNFGIYELSFVDANGCSTKQTISMASPPTDLIINVATGPASCTTSTIEVSVNPLIAGGPYYFALFPIISGSTPPYDYATNMGSYQSADVGFPLRSTFTGLNPGVIYSFIVYDSATNCYYFKQAESPTLTASTLTSTPTANNVKCKGAADGTVDFTFTNTYPVATDVTYQVFNSQTNLPTAIPIGTVTGLNGTVTSTITGLGPLGPGTYYILFKEVSGGANNGCTNASITFTISESPVDLTVLGSIIKNSNCNDDGIIMGQAQGGTASYTYQVTTSAIPPLASDANWVAGNTFTRAGTLAGTTYYVYAKDAYGCIKSDDVILLQDAPPTISAPTPICYDGTAFTINLVTNAAATATITPATYSVNGSAFQSLPSFTFNAAGTYNLVIKDGNGCEADVDFDVYPKLELSAAVTKVLDCTATPEAIITLTATGGNTTPAPNYTYEVNFNGGGFVPAVNPYTATTAGTYDFRVTDANNATSCQTTTSIVVDPLVPIIPVATVSIPLCVGDNANVEINATGGTGNYEFKKGLAGVYSSSNIFTQTALEGTITYYVKDTNDCEFTVDATVVDPVALGVPTIAVTPLTCGTGNIPNGATITVTASGGAGGYDYSFDNGTSYSSSNIITNAIAGTYEIIVKDANGCQTAMQSIVIAPLDPPTEMDIDGTPVYCLPVASQTSTVTISNVQDGIGTFTYQIISPIAAMIDNGTNAVFAGLAPDTYVFQITDNNGCTYQESYTVAPVTNITVASSASTDVTCFGLANGTATFDVANFAGNYNYTFDGAPTNGVNTAQLTFTALAPGLHTLVVTDVITGCQATANVNISQPAAGLDFTATATNINCNNDNATITVVATGGTPTYKYAVLQSPSSAPTLTAYGLSNLLTVDTNGGANMVWDVYVVDANGCPINKPQTIVLDANPSNISVAPFSECPDPINGTYTFTINTPTGVGPFEYSIGGGFQNSPTFVVNAPGSYDVTVKDANGCTTTVPALVVIRQPLILTPTVTTPVSCATNDGVVSVSTTGGSGNYEYRIDSGVYPMTTPFAGLSSGAHTVYVRDTTTGCEVFADITLQAATLITGFDLATTPVTCNGGFDGTITATMDTPAPGVNDNPVYTYTLTGTSITGVPVNAGPQPSPLFSGLEASDVNGYTVVVTSARGCTEPKTIVVTQPAPILVPTIVPVQFGCTSGNVGNLATITVDPTLVTGGSGTYLNYEFIKNGTQVQSGLSNVYTEANLSGGSYIVNVYDSKNCIGTSTAPITIAPYIALDKVDVTVNQAITCDNLENITVTAITIGGPATNLQFTVQDVTYDNSTTPPTANLGVGYNLAPTSVVGNTATFIDLPEGNYEITVRNLDTNCEIIGVHYVNNPDTFDLTIDNVVDVTCLNDTNGSARVTLIDRVPTPDNAGPFTYTVTGPTPSTGTATSAGPINVTNLAAGTYTITAVLTNSPFCSVSKNFTITGPNELLQIFESHTEITCVTGNNDGSISATATGGWPGGYEFQLENGATIVSPWSIVSDFTALTAGTYTVKVRDSRGCEVFTTVVLNNPTPIAFTATPSTTLLTCKGDTSATITVSAPTGGQGSNYLFTLNTTSSSPIISNGPQAGNVFTNLGAGTYTVTVTDGWGCGTTSAPITIAEPTIVSASLVVASTQTCLTQTALTLSAAGGTAPYTYSTTPNFVSSIVMVGNSATFQVPVGTYRYYVRDVNGCTSIVSNDIKIDALVPLTINLDVTNSVNCKDDATGVIVAVANGGLGNYVYTLLDDATNLPIAGAVQTTPGNFTQLVAGNYKVNVVSGDCNTTTSVIQINEPILPLIAPVVVTPVSCNGNGDGKIEINASGGTGIIKYAISPNLNQFFVSGTFINLKPGVYDIITQDQNGCFILDQHTIVEPTSIVANVVPGSIQQELCAGEKTGEFAITITGGTAPYSTSIDNPNGVYVPNQLLFTGLSGGNHTVYIQDANTCTFEMEVALDAAVTLNPIATVSNECVNDLPANKVTVTIDPSNVSTDVKYSLDSTGVEQDSNVFTNLTPGDHFIMVHHKNGCIDATDTFTIDRIDPLTISIDLGGLNEIVATVTGGSGVYRYSVNGQDIGSDNKYIYFRSGDYTVTVTDSNGCSVSATKYFEFIDIKIPNVFTPNGSGTNDSWKPTNTENYPNIKFVVYDRYGREVGTFGAGQFWDGKYNGTELPMGDYWYVLKLKHNQDEREFVGHFTLYR